MWGADRRKKHTILCLLGKTLFWKLPYSKLKEKQGPSSKNVRDAWRKNLARNSRWGCFAKTKLKTNVQQDEKLFGPH